MVYSSSKQASDADESWLSQQQISEALNTQRSAILGNLSNFGILVFVFARTVSAAALILSFVVMIGLLAWRYRLGQSSRDNRSDQRQVVPFEHEIALNALALGCFWGAMVGCLLVIATPAQQLFLAIIGSGMMNAGSITYRTLGRAAQLYIGSCGAGVFVGLAVMGTTEAYAAAGLLLCFCAILVVNAKAASDRFRDAKMQEHNASVSAETIQLLLNDYEEQGSDWLFELDAVGRVCNPCQRFGYAAQRPIETLAGTSFLDLFVDCCATIKVRMQRQSG